MKVRKIQNAALIIYTVFIIVIVAFIPQMTWILSTIMVSIVSVVLITGSIYLLFFDGDTKRLKPFEKITSSDNTFYYLKLLYIVYISIDNGLHPISTIVIITISISMLLFCIWVIVIAIIKRGDRQGVIVGHLIIGYFFYSFVIGLSIPYYGNEVIGSYWSKPDFEAKYFVKLYNPDNDESYILPARLHVFSEAYGLDYGEGTKYSTQDYVLVDTVFLLNGDYLTFDDCNISRGEKVNCYDQHNKYWLLEFIDKRIN